jgi:uncharacterized membrane protein YgcG
MRTLSALLLAFAVTAVPALAKQFVQDQAGILSPGTVSQLNSRIANFNAQTSKEIVVLTVPSVAGGDVRTAAENAFAQQQVNGVLIFVDKGDRKSFVLGDRAAVQAGWWTQQTSQNIVNAMNAQFRAGDFDGGVTTAVNQTFDIYRSHLGSLRSTQPQSRRPYAVQQQSQGGVHISVFWWIIIALFAFFIIRSIMRAASGPRYYSGGPGGPGPGPGGPGYGPGPGYGGYGPGYGFGGGGGGFWSGLLGGLGGAFLGNELFGGRRDFGGGDYANVDPNAGGAPSDAGGWQSDPGQADMGGGAGGDWGGGGFGGGDSGGGFGGGDFGGGGGGGDAGGGW